MARPQQKIRNILSRLRVKRERWHWRLRIQKAANDWHEPVVDFRLSEIVPSRLNLL